MVLSSASERGSRTQISSPWNIKGAVQPETRSHEEQNSLRENSGGRVRRDNSKALLEECIPMWNERYVICPTLESAVHQRARPKRSNLGEGSGTAYFDKASSDFFVKVKDQLQDLVAEIDTFLRGRHSIMDENSRMSVLDDLLARHEANEAEYKKQMVEIYKESDSLKRLKRQDSQYYSSSDDWTDDPQSYGAYDLTLPMVLIQWQTIPSEYDQELNSYFSQIEQALKLYRNPQNVREAHEEHIHDYGDEHDDYEDYKDVSEDDDNEVSLRRMPFKKIVTKPTNAPISHLLQHIYPPWPMNKTNKNNVKT